MGKFYLLTWRKGLWLTALSHWGAIDMLWLHFCPSIRPWGYLHGPIYTSLSVIQILPLISISTFQTSRASTTICPCCKAAGLSVGSESLTSIIYSSLSIDGALMGLFKTIKITAKRRTKQKRARVTNRVVLSPSFTYNYDNTNIYVKNTKSICPSSCSMTQCSSGVCVRRFIKLVSNQSHA